MEVKFTDFLWRLKIISTFEFLFVVNYGNKNIKIGVATMATSKKRAEKKARKIAMKLIAKNMLVLNSQY